MTFRRASIPPQEPSKVGNGKYRCNRRIWIGDHEDYCDATIDSDTRCPDHNPGAKVRAAREEARLAQVVDPASIADRVAELEKDKRNLTRLDELVYNSLATIQELEKRFPISTVSPNEAVTISRLREKHAALVHQRVDLETKLKALLDTDFIFEKAAELFEKNVADRNNQKILLEGIGHILNEIVKGGKSKANVD